MKNRLIALALAAFGFGVAGCAEDRMSLEVYAICAMPETCEFSNSCDMVYAGKIYYKAALGPSDLQMMVELRNQLPNNEDLSVGRVNNNDAHVTGYRLEIDGPISGSLSLDVGHQTVPADGTQLIWTHVLPAYDPVTAPLVDGTYIVNVVYIGYYDNGREFETPGFPIAVEVDASATATPFGCLDPAQVITCGSPQQSVSACGTP